MAHSITRDALEALWGNVAQREATARILAQYGGMIFRFKGDIYVLYGDEWREWEREQRVKKDDVLD